MVLNEKETIAAFKDLIPFVTSAIMRSDVCLVANNSGLSLLLLEVDSSQTVSNYYIQLVKRVAGLLYQFRYFRLFGLDTDNVFPRRGQKNIVTEVRLDFNCLTFRSCFKYLRMEEVIESLRKGLA